MELAFDATTGRGPVAEGQLHSHQVLQSRIWVAATGETISLPLCLLPHTFTPGLGLHNLVHS